MSDDTSMNICEKGSDSIISSYRDNAKLVYLKNGIPLSSREETINVMNTILNPPPATDVADPVIAEHHHQHQRPSINNLYGSDQPFIVSDIPSSVRAKNADRNDGGVIVGIDEAGRGSVLGPMIYGAAYWNPSVTSDKIPKGFNDSKQLNDKVRSQLLDQILENAPDIGFVVRVLHASEISRNMLRAPTPYNLNQMSHDAAIGMIQKLIDADIRIQTCYIDTVGNASTYRRKLEKIFPGIHFVVESKADSKYAPCSAASVVAKVVRDRMLENWQFSEKVTHSMDEKEKKALYDFGSGYPSDPKCTKWIKDNTMKNKIFGYPDLVRFSWGPIKKLFYDDGDESGSNPSNDFVNIKFEADDDIGDEEEQQEKKNILKQKQQMSMFLQKGVNNKKGNNKRKSNSMDGPRFPFFEKNKLRKVINIF